MKSDALEGNRLTARDAWIALGLFAVATAVFVATLQDRLWGDGVDLLKLLEWEQREWWRTWAHTLHTPIAEAFGALGLTGRPQDDFALASAVPAALGGAALYLAARLLAAPRVVALASAALIVFSPVVWFFATLLEVHALHFGVVALALAAALWIGPRTSGWRAHAVHAALFLLVALSHLTALTLVPAWALLGWFVRRPRAHGEAGAVRPRPWQDRRAIAIDGVLATAGFAVALLLSQSMHYGSADEAAVESIADMILGSLEPLRWQYFVDDWIAPMGLATLAALALVAALGVPRWRVALTPDVRDFVLVAVLGGLPLFLFFTAWAFANEGGYVVGWLPFVGVGAALLVGPGRGAERSTALVLTLLVACQVVLGQRSASSYRAFLASTGAPERLAAFAGRLQGGELVVGIDMAGQPLRWNIPGVVELDMIREVRGLPFDEIPAAIARSLDTHVVPFEGPIYVDLSYRGWLVPGGMFEPLILAFEAALLERFDFTAVPDAGWPMVRLVRR